jgi:hypothetical protein
VLLFIDVFPFVEIRRPDRPVRSSDSYPLEKLSRVIFPLDNAGSHLNSTAKLEGTRKFFIRPSMSKIEMSPMKLVAGIQDTYPISNCSTNEP